MTPSTQLSLFLAVSLGLIALYWLIRVAREARWGLVPRVSWWAIPGLLGLLFAPILEVPALFGLGAALLLISEFWPSAFVRSRSRPEWYWPVFGVVLGIALLFAVVRASGPQELALAGAVAALLAGVAGVLSSVFYPRPVKRGWNFSARWASAAVPEWPDLSVTLTGQGAQLINVSKVALNIAGWSPASVNGWLMARDETGKPLNTLRAGQTAFLPLPQHEHGIRVWYSVGKPSGNEGVRLFRADWTPTPAQANRVLN